MMSFALRRVSVALMCMSAAMLASVALQAENLLQRRHAVLDAGQRLLGEDRLHRLLCLCSYWITPVSEDMKILALALHYAMRIVDLLRQTHSIDLAADASDLA